MKEGLSFDMGKMSSFLGRCFAFILKLIRELIPLTQQHDGYHEQAFSPPRLWTLSHRKRKWAAPSREICSKLVKRMTREETRMACTLMNTYINVCTIKSILVNNTARVHTQRKTFILVHFPMQTHQPLHWRS